jgi:hypothetical protein
VALAHGSVTELEMAKLTLFGDVPKTKLQLLHEERDRGRFAVGGLENSAVSDGPFQIGQRQAGPGSLHDAFQLDLFPFSQKMLHDLSQLEGRSPSDSDLYRRGKRAETHQGSDFVVCPRRLLCAANTASRSRWATVFVGAVGPTGRRCRRGASVRR